MRKEQMRCTIRAYNVPLVNELKAETGIDDISDLINFALTDYRRIRTGERTPPQTNTPSKNSRVEEDLSSDIAGLL